jgi:membrane associated rhomboid family serine protease
VLTSLDKPWYLAGLSFVYITSFADSYIEKPTVGDMNTFWDDIRHSFIPRYGAVAQLMLLNIGVYLALVLLAVVLTLAGASALFNELFRWLQLPASVPQLLFQPWSLLTYGVLHRPTDIFHILFNLIGLFYLGQLLRTFANDRVVWFTYVVGVLAGGLAYVLLYNLLPVFAPSVGYTYLNGASAGVLAIVFAVATLVPEYSIHLLLIGPLKLKWLALIYVVLDLVGLLGGNAGGALAHLGGAVTGWFLMTQRQRGRDWSEFLDRFNRQTSRQSRGRSSATAAKTGTRRMTPSAASGVSQAEVDRILDKIKTHGYDKLSLEEKQTLYRASQQ